MSEHVHKIFSEVHKNYDLVNSICSLGTIIQWRKAGAREAMVDRGEYRLLDIATGTGEFAIEIYKEGKRRHKRIELTGIDFAENMLKVAQEKARKRKLDITFKVGDALKLSYPNNHFDVVTSSFALRNVDDLNKFSKEARRVMKKGGKFVFMDMARPDSRYDRLFLDTFWAAVGGIGLMENRDAYDWLVKSVNKFDKRKFVKILKKNGFKGVRSRNLVSGAAFMVTGWK